MTPRKIARALIADKALQATRKQYMDLTVTIRAALRKRNGAGVVSDGRPAQWRLKESGGITS
jgi:hypothetical protein